MADVFTDFFDNLLKGDPAAIGIVVAILIVVLSLLLLLCSGGSNKRRGILLVGISDAGKTLLFSRLVYGNYKPTQTSIKENSGSYTVGDSKKAPLNVIDLPGHERLRTQFLDQFKSTARGIIFVIDSLTFQKEIRDVAEYMYNLLSDSTIQGNHASILVACNKHDQTLAKGSKVIQSQLEKEMNNLRVTKSAVLMGTDNTSSSTKFLGKKDKDFSFSDVKPLKVEFIECSAKGAKDTDGEINQIREWLDCVA